MREFKTLDDILDINKKVITREEFDKLIESKFVDWWENVTWEYFAPHKENCSTYDMKLKDYDNKLYRLYFFVKDDKKEVKSIRDWNSMVDSIFFDDNDIDSTCN